MRIRRQKIMHNNNFLYEFFNFLLIIITLISHLLEFLYIYLYMYLDNYVIM